MATYRYEITDLGLIDGNNLSRCRRMNRSGSVVGCSAVNDPWTGTSQAWIWRPNKPNGRDGKNYPLEQFGGKNAVATGINQLGDVVGYAGDAQGDVWVVKWVKGAGTPLGIEKVGKIDEGEPSGDPSINDGGTIAFTSANKEQVVWVNGKLRPLDPGNFGGVSGMGDGGDVVGHAGKHNGTYQATVWKFTGADYGTGVNIGDDSQGGPAYRGSGFASDINRRSEVTGNFLDGNNYQAFLWTNNRVISLTREYIEGTSMAVNDRGQVVGYFAPAPNQRKPFLYEGSNETFEPEKWVNLQTQIDPAEGWDSQEAQDINEQGQIIEFGYHQGRGRAFLLTPTETSKPGCVLALIPGVAFLNRLGKR